MGGETASWRCAPGPCRAGMHARLMHSVSASRALAGGSGGVPSAFPSSAGDAAAAARAAPCSLQLSGSDKHHAQATAHGGGSLRTEPFPAWTYTCSACVAQLPCLRHGVQGRWFASPALQLCVPRWAGAVMLRHRSPPCRTQCKNTITFEALDSSMQGPTIASDAQSPW